MRDAYDKLHYTGPAAILGPLAFAGRDPRPGRGLAGRDQGRAGRGAPHRREPGAHPRDRAGAVYPSARPTSSRSRRPTSTRRRECPDRRRAHPHRHCRDPGRGHPGSAPSALTVSLFGILLGILFFAVQAPDVALSEIVSGPSALPLMILLALAKVRGGTDDAACSSPAVFRLGSGPWDRGRRGSVRLAPIRAQRCAVRAGAERSLGSGAAYHRCG